MYNSCSQFSSTLALYFSLCLTGGNRWPCGPSNCGVWIWVSTCEETEAGSHSGTNCCWRRSQRGREERTREILSSWLEQLPLSREEGEVSAEMLRVHLSCHLYGNCPLFCESLGLHQAWACKWGAENWLPKSQVQETSKFGKVCGTISIIKAMAEIELKWTFSWFKKRQSLRVN